MQRNRGAGFALLLLLLAADAAFAQTIHVAPLARDGRVLVTFRLSDAFNEDVRTAVHSGLTITFVYEVELKRTTTLWVDRTVAAASVTAGVRYDNLTRRYHVTRKEDGRIDRAETTDSEEVARNWLTDFDKLPLFRSDRLERNGEYYLRVRAHTTPRNASFVWPWQHAEVVGLAKFTFIP
jgi:hypothetical protein